MERRADEGTRVERILPPAWLVPARVERVILHWTAGTYRASELDRQHYHFILEDAVALGDGGDIRVVRGRYTPADNERTPAGMYAAHCRGANSRSVGIAVACMLGALQGEGHGDHPLTERLWERLAQTTAEVCRRYRVPVGPRTVLQHGEVERQLGLRQAGKWDITELSFARELTPEAVCDQFRRKVCWYLERME